MNPITLAAPLRASARNPRFFQVMLLGVSLISSGITLSLVLAAFGLACSFYLIRMIVSAPAGDGRMKEVASAIQEGARAYLNRQVRTIGVIAILVFILAYYFKGMPTALGFLIGAACSLAAGFVGMRIAVLANVRTAYAAGNDRHSALCMAFNGGAVTGLLVVGLALLSVGIFYRVALNLTDEHTAINSLVGLALGSSLISVFARLGGGIYTKAADVGADLVGKIESHLDEDDPRNPATIADNVGDNVGDCAGMAADVFETYAVSLIGAVLIGALTLPGVAAAIVYPFLLGGVSIVGAVLGMALGELAAGFARQAAPGGGGCEQPAVRHPVSADHLLDVPHAADHRFVHVHRRRHLPFFLGWRGADGSRGAHHELLHLDEFLAGAQDRAGQRDGSCDQHHRRSCHRATRHGVCRWCASAQPSC